MTAAALIVAYMQAVNISLPNAALLYIQGTLSMSDDEVGWIFTSYIVASVITAPMARWLAGRYGRKVVFQLSIAAFRARLLCLPHAPTPRCNSSRRALSRALRPVCSGRYRWRSCLTCRRAERQARMSLVWTVTVLLGLLSGPSIGGWVE